MLAGWPSHIRIPVKLGQKDVDVARLPFACITIGTAGVSVPLERVVIENVDSHEELTAQIGRTFGNGRPDYPYGGDEKRRALSMAILELPPGHYRLKLVEFTPEGKGISSLTFPLSSNGPFCFTIKPGCVNYVGTVIFAANWVAASTGGVQTGWTINKRFNVQITTERTAMRDQRWASKLIPCMALLPWQESPFGSI
jgi:hypothetical protein